MSGRGSNSKAGFKRAATWGTAVTVTANDGFYYTSEGITDNTGVDDDPSLTGNMWGNEPSLGNEAHNGPTNMLLRYGYGCPVFAAHALGTDTILTVSTAGGVYLHQMSIDDDNALFGTLVIGKDFDVWEYPSATVSKLTITGSAAERVTLTPEYMCRDVDVESTTNTTTSLENSVSFNGFSKPIYTSCGRLRIHNMGTTDSITSDVLLDADDEVNPANFEIVLDNGYVGDFLMDADNCKKMQQPVRDTFGSVTGFFEFNERTANTYDQWFRNENVFKAELLFESTATIAGSLKYYWKFTLPYARVTKADAPVDGPDRISQRVEFKAIEVDSVSTDMYSGGALNILIQDTETSPYTTTGNM